MKKKNKPEADSDNSGKTYGMLTFPGNDHFVINDPNDISFVEAGRGCVEIHFKDKNRDTKVQAIFLCAMQKMLDPACFLRCHNSFIISLDFVKSYCYHDKYIIAKLKDGNHINVSCGYIRAFRAMLPLYPAITRL